MDFNKEITPAVVLHWNYRGFTEFPIHRINGDETEITDIYLKENLISQVPSDICKLENLESLYLSGNDITELPKEISKLRCLKCMDISGNRLRCLPEEIGEMRSLKFLILDENELTELPLRLSELRALRYLSVCDNKLQWLPQRPVYNYHHCEFRFWRNAGLKTLPYSLWYHMFRDQQTRSLNIGCLSIPNYQHISKDGQLRLKLSHDSRQWDVDVTCSPKYVTFFGSDVSSAPSLYELCKRVFYEMISNEAKQRTADVDYSCLWHNFYGNYRMKNLQETFEEIALDNNNSNYDINGNSDSKVADNINNKYELKRSYFGPADIIDEYYNYLPHFLKRDLCNGPFSKCENVECKKPIFDYAHYEFCFGKIILIDNIQEIILNAAFCSKSCANKWKKGKAVIPSTLL